MTDGKPTPPLQTPFERLTDFTKRIIAVPNSEVEQKMRDFQRKRKRRKSRLK